MKFLSALGAVILFASLLIGGVLSPAIGQTEGDFSFLPEREFQDGIGPRQNVKHDPDDRTLPSASKISDAFWVGVSTDGTEFRERITRVEPDNADASTFIRNSSSGVSLYLATPCIYEDPALAAQTVCQAHPAAVRGYIEVVLQDGGRFRSDSVSVDFKAPEQLRSQILSSTQITTFFDEPVRVFNNTIGSFQDSPSDWIIRSTDTGQQISVVRVTSPQNDCVNTPGHIGKSGCTRVLTLSRPLSEDEEVTVQYNQELLGDDDPTREQYEDANGIKARMRLTRAFDLRRPRLPDLQTVDGRALASPASGEARCPGTLRQHLTNDTTPSFRFDNITEGHGYTVVVDTVEVVAVRMAGTTRPIDVQVEKAINDGAFVATVVAIDDNGNRSNDPALNPPLGATEGNPNVCLVIDTVRPNSTFAQRRPQVNQIDVRFSERLAQGDRRGTWSIPSAPGLTATGVQANSDNTVLTVTFSGTVPPLADRITWTPGEGTDVYTDRAGNALVAVSEPIETVGQALRPVFTAPTAAVLAGPKRPVSITGTINAQNVPSDVSQVTATLAVAPQGAAAVNQNNVSYNGETGNWTVNYPFSVDGVHQFTATASNPFGTSDPSLPSGRIEWDGTRPTVAIISQEPSGSGTILDPSQPAEEPAGGDIVVRLRVTDEPNLQSLTVSLTYAGASQPAVQKTITAAEGLRRTGGEIEVTLEQTENYIGDATIAAVAVDAVDNTSSRVERAIDLVDDLDEAPIGTLVSNTATDPRIRLTFPAALTGSSSFNDWSATNGIPGDNSSRKPRLNGVERPQPDVVELVFSQQFPALLAPDMNAEPRVTYSPGLGSNLRTDDERRLNVQDVRARDITPPGVPVVTSAPPSRPLNLTSNQSNGADCSTSPPARGCPGTYTFDVQTHASQNPNYCEVTQVPSADGTDRLTSPIALPCGDKDGRVNPNGTFQVTVPVVLNATNTYRIEVEDPAGNPGTNPTTGQPEGVTVTVVEDSIGPNVQTLFASLKSGNVIDITYGFAPADGAQSVDLSYIPTGQTEPRSITTRSVPASGTETYTWNVPSDVDLTAGGLRIVAVGRDSVPNLGVEKRVGLGNVPQLRSATAGQLTEVLVSISEPVTTEQAGAAGFAILGGPGVTSVAPAGDSVVRLTLNGPLPTNQELSVAYNGQGGFVAPDGRPLAAGRVPLALSIGLQPVQDLVAGPNGTGGAVLSWVDEINPVQDVAGYELSRGGQVVATVDRTARAAGEAAVPSGSHTYQVVTLGVEGERSEPAVVTLKLGASPVPAGPGQDAVFGGTSAPDGSTITDPCAYTAEPNVTRAGGWVVSCDGLAVVLVPAGVADEAMFGKLIRRTAPAADGFTDKSALYQLVGVTADDYAVVDAFDGYAEFSFRGQRQSLTEGNPALTTSLRHVTGGAEEQAPRVSDDAVASQIITFGSLGVAESTGRTLRVFGPDPAIAADRFATAAGLSQTQFRRAGAAVLARADDYPDALSAAPLAAQVGGPVLLTRTASLPDTTAFELERLDVEEIILVGGEAAIGPQVALLLAEKGYTVTRIGGEDRFQTSALIAERVGTIDGAAFLATGLNFADALSASAPAAAAGRAILLTQTSRLTDRTLQAMEDIGIDRVRVVGGPVAVSDDAFNDVTTAGFVAQRSSGPDRYATSIVLAADMLAEALIAGQQPLIASGDGDGRTSPDALAAGPIGGRLGSYLVLVPRTRLPDDISAFLSGRADIEGIMMAGGPAAVTDEVRSLVDATG